MIRSVSVPRATRTAAATTMAVVGFLLGSWHTQAIGGTPPQEDPSLLSATLLPAVGDAEGAQLALRWHGEPGARLSVTLMGPRGEARVLVPGHALEAGVSLLPLRLDAGIEGRLRLQVLDADEVLLATREEPLPSLRSSAGFAWKPSFYGKDLSGTVRAVVVWDDGGGPALYLGGGFVTAGHQVVNHIARWDGSRWSSLSGPSGTGMNGLVLALTIYDGHLVAGGSFSEAGGVAANRVARWDGMAWAPFSGPSGIGPAHGVSALTVRAGELVVGGFQGISRWDGSDWSPVPGLVDVRALAVYDSHLVAGGHFGEGPGHIARWDGNEWQILAGPSGGLGWTVEALTIHEGGLVAGGCFDGGVARWDGSDWSRVGALSGSDGCVAALAVYGSDLVAGGRFMTAEGVTVNRIARWDGGEWHPLSGPSGSGVGGILPDHSPAVLALAVYDGDLFAGGWFTLAGGLGVDYAARWNGIEWSPISEPSLVDGGVTYHVEALTVYEGDLIAGGWFTEAGGSTVNHIARWDGRRWRPLGTGVTRPFIGGRVNALAVYDGDLVAGGWFTEAGGVTVNRIAGWDGRQWSALGNGMVATSPNTAFVSALAVYDGDLVAGGFFEEAGGATVNHIARWDGSQWSPFAGPFETGMNSFVGALAVYDGDLVAGGRFTEAGGVTVNSIARWDGSQWFPLGTGMDAGPPHDPSVNTLAVFDGGLVAGGRFTEAGGVAARNIGRWDGSEWSSLAVGVAGFEVNALAVYGVDLVAGGSFQEAGDVAARNIARWDGNQWSPLFGPAGNGANGEVQALVVHGSDLAAGGLFTLTGGVANWRVGLYGPPCVADARRLCFHDFPGDGRFEVWMDFETTQSGGLSGQGRSVPLAGLGVTNGGLFHFGDPTNPEMLIKVLDGCAINDHNWVFHSAGTNVGFTVTVRDHLTGGIRTYSNPDLAPAAPVQDTKAFACPAGAAGSPSGTATSSGSPPRRDGGAQAAEGCASEEHALCIAGRFRVEIDFETFQAGGLAGMASAIPLTHAGVDRGGLFHFGNPTNPEVLVKVLDGCALNDHLWVFFSAGTNVALQVRVTDTATGEKVEYFNPDLTPVVPVQDTSALPCD